MSDQFEQQWLSDLPEDWTEKRADFLCRPYRVTVDPDVFGDGLVAHYSIPQVQETGGPLIESASDIDSSKLFIDSPTLLVSKLNPRKKTICIAEPHLEHPTLASGEFVAINSEEMDRRYAYFLWCSEKVTDRLSAIVQSVTRSHQRVNPADILKLPWKWPPLETQRRIARFLDEKTARIDGLIEKKRTLLDRLAEKRQALITRAVTKGLNPDAPMKLSGIDWIGDIPAHWDIQRLDRLTEPRRPIRYGIVLPGPHVDNGVPIIKGGDVRPIRLNFDTLSRTTQEIDAAHFRSRLKAGDIVYSIRGSFGDVELLPPELDGINLTQDAARIAPIKEVDREWLLLTLKSDAVLMQMAAGAIGATIKGINIRDLRRAILPLPPRAEQVALRSWLNSRVTEIDRQRDLILKSSILLEEYRAALITAAVAGQLVELR